MTDNYKPANYRIISIRQRRRILHIEDALDLDRIRFDLWDYDKGNGARANTHAYVERHAARAIAAELATGKLHYFSSYTANGGGTQQGQLTARLFSIENADTKNPIRITVTNGEGTKLAGGLISLKKGGTHTRLQILLSRTDAKMIGLAILHHIQAWEIITFKDRTADTWKPDSQPDPILCPDCNTHPCICETIEATHTPPTTRETQGDTPPTADDGILRYADGDLIAEDNPHEIQALQAYVTAEKQIPPSRKALRQWVKDTPKQRPQ